MHRDQWAEEPAAVVERFVMVGGERHAVALVEGGVDLPTATPALSGAVTAGQVLVSCAALQRGLLASVCAVALTVTDAPGIGDGHASPFQREGGQQ